MVMVRSLGREGARGEPVVGNSATEMATNFGAIIAPPTRHQWNRIEHCMFSLISINWRSRPLLSHQVIVQLIASTKTDTGLNIVCDVDWGRYQKGINVPKAALKELNIYYDDFHGDGSYTIAPFAKEAHENSLM
jgi:Rhodopirellula transposase DDE domain